MLRYKRPPQFEEEEEELQPKPSRFIRVLSIVVVITFVVLAYNLYQIQVVNYEFYRTAAERNLLREVTVDAPRGVMYDRNGKILVRNEPSFQVSIVPADLPADRQEEVLEKLSKFIDAPLETRIEAETVDALGSLPSDVSRTFVAPTRKPGLRELIDQGRLRDPFAPALLKTDVPRIIALTLEERAYEFPGLRVEIDPVRDYPEQELTSHLLGYIGPIPREFFPDYAVRDYEQNDRVGITGLEQSYEDQLRGKSGRRVVVVDVNGIAVRTLEETPPRPGNNLYLTIDLDLQRATEAALLKGMKAKNAKQGVAIVMNPNNGEILAMVSLPTFDNNLFSRGIKTTDYQALSQDAGRPLVNHAIAGMYPPGSVYKLLSAAGALQEGVIDTQQTIFDPGIIYLPNRFFPEDQNLAQPFYCWLRSGHGSLNIVEGIAQSCDVFFYKLDGGFTDFPTPLGQALVAEYARLFGYGVESGIDLPGEAPGLVPDPKWKQRTLNEQWVTGDTYNMAIGQGFVLATPLQVLNTTATVANGGTLYRPHLVRSIVNASGTLTNTIEPQVIRKLPIDPENLAIVREGMRGAVTHGTSWKINLVDVPVAGKTGTAEFFGPRIAGHLPTHAWFTAFAPYDKPQVAVVVFVNNGGEGSEVAVPIATDILRAYFKLPPDAPLIPNIKPPPPETRSGQVAAPPPPAPTAPQYAGRLVGVQDNSSERPVLFGTVVDAAGNSVGGVTVSLDTGDGQAVASTVTAGDGSFRFPDIDIARAPRWFLRLSGTAASSGVAIDVAPFKQYQVQFSAAGP